MWITSKFPSFRSQEQKDLKDGTSKSQTVGSLLSAYDDDSHDETEDTGKNAVAKVETGPETKTVPTVESRSWSNWEDMWLSFSFKIWGGASVLLIVLFRGVFGSDFCCKMPDLMYLNVFWLLYILLGWAGHFLCDGKVPKLLWCTRRNLQYFNVFQNLDEWHIASHIFLPSLACCYNMFIIIYIYNHWPSLIFKDYYVFWVVFNAFRLDPRRRHGIVMGKQPEDLVLAWPRDLSHYPPGYPPAQPPGCCTQRCHCMDGTKRHTFPSKKWHKFDGLR